MGISRIAKATVLVTAISLVAVATACAGNSSSSSRLFPQRATAVASIEFGELVDSSGVDLVPVFQAFASAFPGGSSETGEFFTLGQAAAFISDRDIGRVDLFGEGDAIEFGGYVGVVIHGSYDEAALIADLEAASDYQLVKEVYKGVNVYSPEGEIDGVIFSVLDPGMFAVGTGGALEDIIDIWVGEAESASGPTIDLLNDLSGGVFAFAVKVPQDALDGGDIGPLSQFGDLPVSMDFISSLDILGVGGELSNDSVDITMALDFTDQEAAESLEEFISGIVTLASNFSDDPATAELLDGLEVDRDGRRLTIKAGIPKSELTDAFSDLTTITSTTQSAGWPPGTPAIRLLESAIGDEIAIMPSADHVPEGQNVDYSTTPPTSGMHWSRWADCGWYPDGLPDEVITHNLEHGNIVVSYNFTNPAQTTELRQVLDGVARFGDWGVARSYDKIPDGQIALAAWGRLDTFQGVAAGKIELFFEAFAGLMGPERIPC